MSGSTEGNGRADGGAGSDHRCGLSGPVRTPQASRPTKRSCSLRSRASAFRPEKRVLPRSDLGVDLRLATRRASGGPQERVHAPPSPYGPGHDELAPEAVEHLARHVDGLCCFSCSDGRVSACGSPPLGVLDAGGRMAASGHERPSRIADGSSALVREAAVHSPCVPQYANTGYPISVASIRSGGMSLAMTIKCPPRHPR